MRKSVIILAYLFLINSCSAYFEDLIQLTTDLDTTIETGRYKSITVNGNANLNVTGGTIGGITCNDNVNVVFNGGTIVGGFSEPTDETYMGQPIYIAYASSGTLTMNNNSCATMLSGNPRNISCNDNSKLDAYAGTFGLSFSGNALMNIYGGQITLFHWEKQDPQVWPPESTTIISSCTINIFGGDLLGTIRLILDESLNIYGSNFHYDPLGTYYDNPKLGRIHYGLLTGIWADSTPFSMTVANQETFDRISLNLIPEPATLFLMIVGGFMIRKYNSSHFKL
ncbi:MAG: hypothetical protein ABFD79_04680 [Phycisphaerales bacterium]